MEISCVVWVVILILMKPNHQIFPCAIYCKEFWRSQHVVYLVSPPIGCTCGGMENRAACKRIDPSDSSSTSLSKLPESSEAIYESPNLSAHALWKRRQASYPYITYRGRAKSELKYSLVTQYVKIGDLRACRCLSVGFIFPLGAKVLHKKSVQYGVLFLIEDIIVIERIFWSVSWSHLASPFASPFGSLYTLFGFKFQKQFCVRGSEVTRWCLIMYLGDERAPFWYVANMLTFLPPPPTWTGWRS